MTEATEMCPHCQNEVTVQWNVEKDGYELYCPYCGFPVMLCSMCDARDGKVCDWEEIKGCKHSDERYRDYFYKNLSCENAAEIARSSRDNNGWIPVGERLPEEEASVLVQWEKYDRHLNVTLTYLDVMWLDDADEKVFETINGVPNGKVIAWRPLPDPYRPERSSDEKE